MIPLVREGKTIIIREKTQHPKIRSSDMCETHVLRSPEGKSYWGHELNLKTISEPINIILVTIPLFFNEKVLKCRQLRRENGLV